MALAVVYATFPDRSTAQELARQMVEARLAACATFWDAGSFYWWEGRVEEAEETLAFFKTSTDQVEGLIDALAAAHPYDVPCIIALPAGSAHPGYGQWVQDEVATGPHGS